MMVGDQDEVMLQPMRHDRGHHVFQAGRLPRDGEILRHFTAVIDFPDFRSPVITRVVEPVWKAMLAVVRAIVRW